MIPELGERWQDRYRLLRLLGGGASAVFLAKDEQRDEDVVLKILRPDLMHAESAFTAWLTDARVRARLSGPLPKVYDLRFAPVPYSVSELVDGETLLERLQRGLLTDASLAKGAAAILEGLARVGVGAADLDPTNWLITAGGVRYIDFGDVELSVDLHAKSRGPVVIAELRRRLGELFYAATTGRDATGRWTEQLREAGVPMAARAPADPAIEALLAGEAITPADALFAVKPLPPPAEQNGQRPDDPLAIDALQQALIARGDDVWRVSPVAKVDTLGLTHVSKRRFAQWTQMHTLAGTSAVVLVEDPASMDAETRAALQESAGAVPCVFIG